MNKTPRPRTLLITTPQKRCITHSHILPPDPVELEEAVASRLWEKSCGGARDIRWHREELGPAKERGLVG